MSFVDAGGETVGLIESNADDVAAGAEQDWSAQIDWPTGACAACCESSASRSDEIATTPLDSDNHGTSWAANLQQVGQAADVGDLTER